MKLQTKVGVVLLVTFVVLGGVVLGSTELFKQQTIDAEKEDLQQTTTLTADQVEVEIDREKDYVRRFGQSDELVDTEAPTETIVQFLSESSFLAGGIVAQNGTVIEYLGEVPDETRTDRIGSDLSDEAFFTDALAGRTTIRAPEADRNSNDTVWTVLIAAPIGDLDNPDGVLIGVGQLGQLTDGADGTTIPTWNEAVLTVLEPLETDVQTVQITGETLSGEKATFREPSGEFDSTIQANSTVEATGWQLGVIRDTGPLDSRLDMLLLFQGVGLLLIGGVVGGIGYWEYKTYLQQTEELLDGFEALSEGQFERELSLSAAEEWERISDGFNEMGESLFEREQQLSVLTRVLRHNLQNDLTIVRTYGELVVTFEEQEQRENASEKILEMTDKLLGHAEKAKQIDAAREVSSDGLTRVNVTSVIEHAVKSTQREYPDASYEIVTELPDSNEQFVWAIPVLDFGIQTLVENAVVHNASDEPLVIVTIAQPSSRTVTITVKDNGPGIPEHEYEVLFNQEETDLEHGSGVGLWLAHIVTKKSMGSMQLGDQSDGGEMTVVLNAASGEKAASED